MGMALTRIHGRHGVDRHIADLKMFVQASDKLMELSLLDQKKQNYTKNLQGKAVTQPVIRYNVNL